MDFVTVLIAILVVGLFACMTADVILDMETIWNSQFEERGSGRIEEVSVFKADISWVQAVEDEYSENEVDVIQIAKSRTKLKPVVQAGIKVRQLLDNLGKQVQDYSQLTVRQLKQLAKERGVAKYGSLRKADLIAALQSS